MPKEHKNNSIEYLNEVKTCLYRINYWLKGLDKGKNKDRRCNYMAFRKVFRRIKKEITEARKFLE